MKNDIINSIVENISVDPRLETGIFDVTNDYHLEILREYLNKLGIAEDITIEVSNKLLETGKHPERQAYNKDGLLVTFPSPEYKQRALQRGTHFDQNPKTSQTNIFSKDQPQQANNAEPQDTGEQAPVEQPDPTPSPETQNIDTRTPQEKVKDAKDVETVLKLEYSLEEAISKGFYKRFDKWYSPCGKEFVIEHVIKFIQSEK